VGLEQPRGEEMAMDRDSTGQAVSRRASFRASVERLSQRARSTELLRMLILPGAFALVTGFVLMFLGWYGAARTPREIEQIPYLLSGGFIGLGLVFIGGLLLASAFWMSMLQKFSEEADKRGDRQMRELEARLRAEPPASGVGRKRAAPRRRSPASRPRRR
jgi:hypothetical protein